MTKTENYRTIKNGVLLFVGGMEKNMSNQNSQNRKTAKQSASAKNANGHTSTGRGGASHNGAGHTGTKQAGTKQTGKKAKKKVSSAKKRRQKKIIIFAVEMVVLAILLVALFFVSKLNKLEKDVTFNEEDLQVNELDEATAEVLEGYTTIALFGIDNHSSGNLSSGRSDSMMIACINNDTKMVRIVSVYRDTYLNLTDGSYNKANGAYSAGGPTQAISMLNSNLDLDISDYVTVDFSALVDIVDLLGGLTLDISEDEMMAMNGLVDMGEYYSENYIKVLSEETGKDADPVFAGDNQLLNGVQVTAYCRIRYTSGDDFKRTERQRLVVSKIIEKLKEADLATLNKIIDAAFPKVKTSFTNAEVLALASHVSEYTLEDTAGFPFLKNTGTVGSKGSLVIPCDLLTNVDYLHTYLYADESYEPTSTVEKISEKIESDTGMGLEDANELMYGSLSLDEVESATEGSTNSSSKSDSSDSSDSSGSSKDDSSSSDDDE